MIRLVGVEVRRLLSRRVIRLFGLLILAGILIAGVTVFFRSERLTPERSAELDAERAKRVQECIDGFEGERPPGQTLEEFCESIQFGTSVDPRWHLTDVQNVFEGTLVPLVLLAWVIGATAVGADWHSGTMATTLTWEPRRVRLHAGKAIAVLAFVFVSFFAVQTALGLALAPAAVLRGTTAGVDAGWLSDTAVVLLRGAVLSAIAAALGFSLASVSRNTAAGVGIGFGYLVIAENLLGALFPRILKWLLVPNSVVFVLGERFDISLGRTAGEAAILLTVYAVGALVAATAVFRARDVT